MTATEQEMVKALEQIEDLACDALNPILTRENVIGKVQVIHRLAFCVNESREPDESDHAEGGKPAGVCPWPQSKNTG